MTRLPVVLLCILAACSKPDATPTPTLILHNANVWTADSDNPAAEAVALAGETTLAVGTDTEVLALAGPQTKRVDLGGRCVIASAVDAHIHAAPPFAPDWWASAVLVSSFDEVLSAVSAKVAVSPVGQPIVSLFHLPFYATAAGRAPLDELSAAAPNHVVVAHEQHGHGMLVNRATLTTTGISEYAAEVYGGRWGKTEMGQLNGWVFELAEVPFHQQERGGRR